MSELCVVELVLNFFYESYFIFPILMFFYKLDVITPLTIFRFTLGLKIINTSFRKGVKKV